MRYYKGKPFRMELLERLRLLSGPDELDRHTDSRTQRDGGTAPGIPVHFRQHGTVVLQPLMECLRGVHRVLPRHGIDNEQYLVRLDGCLDRLRLLHHFFVDVQAAGGIHNHHVTGVLTRMLHRTFRHLDRPRSAFGEDRNADLLAEHLQLINGRRTMHIGRRQQRKTSLTLQMQCELRTEGGLAGALQSRNHDHRWRQRRKRDPDMLAPQKSDQLIVYDLDDQLSGGNAVQHILTHRPPEHVVNELTRNFVVDVGIQEDTAHLTEGLRDIRLGDFALSAQALQDFIKFSAEIF